MSGSRYDAPIGARLATIFSQALKRYQVSNASFRVLCSLPPATTIGTANADVAPAPPPRPPRFVLVLDSSFNPPTRAHQRMALSALADPRYATTSRILLLLATTNADKAPKPAAFPQRLAMMYLFAQDLLSATRGQGGGGVAVDIAVTTEPYFNSKSKAIAECDFYRGVSGEGETEGEGEAGSGSRTEHVYLTGFDTLIRIFNPKYYPKSMVSALDPLFANARLRVSMRTDADWGDAAEQRGYLDSLAAGKLQEVGGKTAWAAKVEMVEGRGDGEEVISSTKVRDAIRKQDWDGLAKLVSPGIAEWVRDQGLYTEEAARA